MARPPATISARPSPFKSAARASSQAMPPSSTVCRSKASGFDPSLGSNTKTPGPWDRRAGLVRVALTDDQFIVVVAVKIGRPDGMAPLQGFGDHLATRDRSRTTLMAVPGPWCRRRPGSHARARSWQYTVPTAKSADLDLARSFKRPRILVPGAEPRFGPSSRWVAVEQEHTLPARARISSRWSPLMSTSCRL